MIRNLLAATVTFAALAGFAHAQTVSDDPNAIIERFAADYAHDPYLDRETVFGVEVDGSWWTVSASPGANGAPGHVVVGRGRPTTPTFYFTADRETLRRIGDGSLNALTAMGKARESDAAPMDVETMDGFSPDEQFGSWVVPFIFHFWTEGQPEIVPFNSEATRTVHGAQVAVFYYQEGFRSAFVEIRPGQHVNADPRDQTNPFPTLLIILDGRISANIGGRSIELSGGNAIFIPAGVSHEFTNTSDAPGHGILLMFGEGA